MQKFEVTTELEKDVAAILSASQSMEVADKFFTAAEELALKGNINNNCTSHFPLL